MVRRTRGFLGLAARRGLIGVAGVASALSIGFGFAFLLGVVLLAAGAPLLATTTAAAFVVLAATTYVLWATYAGVKSQRNPRG